VEDPDTAVREETERRDYRAPEAKIHHRFGTTRWFEEWARRNRPGARFGDQDLGLTWQWVHVAHAHLDLSPACRGTTPTTKGRARYRHFEKSPDMGQWSSWAMLSMRERDPPPITHGVEALSGTAVAPSPYSWAVEPTPPGTTISDESALPFAEGPLVSAQDRSGPDVKSLGSYEVILAESYLEFPEPNQIKMVNRRRSVLRVLQPLRFLERSYAWSGHGIHQPPTISATVEGSDLRPRMHGRTFRDGNGRGYLVDLGAIVEPYSEIDLLTESVYIDEAGVFERFFSFTASASIQALTVTVAFMRPPANCAYSFLPLNDSVWTAAAPVLPDTRNEWTQYSVGGGEKPARAGVHKLTWA